MNDYEKFLQNKGRKIHPVGFEVGKLNKKLFPFQEKITRWALKLGRAALFEDTGLGKSFQELEWAHRVCEETGGDVLILAPLAVAAQTKREADHWGIKANIAKEASEMKRGINITNYDRLEKFDGAELAGVVCDECFPKDTLVDAYSNGSVIKRHIQNIRYGDKICNASGVDTVTEIHRRRIKCAIAVKVGSNRIISSENHPWFTQRGWVSAIDLVEGDSIMETRAAMRLVSRGNDAEVGWSMGQEVLREILFSEMEDEAAEISGESSQQRRLHASGNLYEQMVCVGDSQRAEGDRAYSQVESNVRRESAEEDEPHIACDEAQTYRAWWKRERYDEASGIAFGITPVWMGSRICRVAWKEGSRISNSIQNRLGESRIKTRDRGGWAHSQINETQGPKEGCETGFIRVEGIEVLELGHPELDKWRDAEGVVYFYDIKAKRHPSFSVNGLLVHNSSAIKAETGKRTQYILDRFAHLRFKLAGTATPAPNDYMELGTHAEFLGVMTRSEMLSTFFVHDGGETSKWRLKGHGKKEFWRWVSTWAICITSPSDIGFDGKDYELPPMNQFWHAVEGKAINDGMLIPMPASTLGERREARRESIEERLKLALKLVMEKPDDQWVIWCDYNAESEALTKGIPEAVEITGSDDRDFKEQALLDFVDGKIKRLVTKADIAGYGINMQNCFNTIHFGISDSFEDLYQKNRRFWRFGQKNTVTSHIITSTQETAVVENIKRKERDNVEMKREMATVISTAFLQADKKKVMKTNTAKGRNWTLDLHDCVEASRDIADNSVGYSIMSPPFASLYVYSDSERDMGNCIGAKEFYEHFQFLVGELHRITMPGRLLSFHCMNLPMTKGRDGFIGIRDFRGELIKMFTDAGWIFHSEVCIWKDPVTAMQRTKAIGLLHKQIKKDATISRQGIADYLVTMRKRGENENRVAHGADLPVELWQRYASPVWMDINPSDTLQRESARENADERHICPLQLQVIQRGIHLWSNPNDLVFSPFAGIGSEGYVAVKMGRKFHGIELKKSYWDQARLNLMAAEEAKEMDLFANVEEENRCVQTQIDSAETCEAESDEVEA